MTSYSLLNKDLHQKEEIETIILEINHSEVKKIGCQTKRYQYEDKRKNMR